MFSILGRKPSPSEYGVLVWLVAFCFLVIGIVALVMAYRAPAEKHDLAMELAHRGFSSVGIGAAILFFFWLYRRLRD
jgi:hypothetical protein